MKTGAALFLVWWIFFRKLCFCGHDGVFLRGRMRGICEFMRVFPSFLRDLPHRSPTIAAPCNLPLHPLYPTVKGTVTPPLPHLWVRKVVVADYRFAFHVRNGCF
jgi:hypothetical protein